MKAAYHKKGKSPQKIEPIFFFATVPLLEYGSLKPILPFTEGRSGAPRRYLAPASFPLIIALPDGFMRMPCHLVGPPMETHGLCSVAARRGVIPLHAVPIDNRINLFKTHGLAGNRCAWHPCGREWWPVPIPRNARTAMPTVGAGLHMARRRS